MTTGYDRDSVTQRRRRGQLDAIRAQLGDEHFAAFIIDMLAMNGVQGLDFQNLSALVPIWQTRMRQPKLSPSPYPNLRRGAK